MTAYIGYNNLIEDSAVTVTSEATGYEKENAYDWLTSDWWQADAAGAVYFYIDLGSSMDVDSWGVAAHNLSDNSGTIKPQYSSTGAWAGEEVDFNALVTPTNNDPIFRKKNNVNARYWRFAFDSTTIASFIGMLFLGTALELPLGIGKRMTPPRMSKKNKVLNNKTTGGAFIGRSLIREGLEFSISQDYVSRAWMDSNWDALAEHIELKPFFFSWDFENYPDEATYCWLSKGKAPVPRQATPLYLRFSFKVNGI